MTRSVGVALLGATLTAACSDDDTPTNVPVTLQVIEETTFAEELGIDLSLMTKTASGMYIQILKEGEGEAAEPGDFVDVAYTGVLSNGTVFDAGGFPFTLGAGRAIAGFDEGVTGMQLHEERVIIIPPALGYGTRAQGSIPGGSILVFALRLDVLEKTEVAPPLSVTAY